MPALVIPPHNTTTTRAPRTTTTRPARTTTTRPPRTTTTTSTTTTTATTASSLGAAEAQPPLQLTAFRATSDRLVATSDATTTTTTTIPSASSDGSSSSGGSTNAADRAALLATLSNLNRSHAQIKVNQAVDLAYLANYPHTPNVSPAPSPGSSANGSLLRTLAIFGGVGLLLGIVAAFILATTRRRFEHAEDPAELYGAPLITTVPVFDTSAWSHLSLPVLTAPVDEAAEAYRILGTILRARRGESDTLVVAFSAADLRAGTTTTVANCGLALAEMGERVLVIDADPLGRGLTHLLLDHQGTSELGTPPMGLAELLEGRSLNDTILPALGHTGLMVVPCGRDSEMAIRRWRSGTLRRALEDLSERFDVILIDTPPMGTSSFSMDLSAVAEHLIMVIPHYDSVDLHETIARRLPVMNVEMLGYLYNGTPTNIRFSPYVPLLREGHPNSQLQRAATPLPPAAAAAPPVGRPPDAPTSSTTSPPTRISTGTVTATQTATVQESVPGAGPAASGGSERDVETGEVPAVAPKYFDDTAVIPSVHGPGSGAD